MRISSHFIIDAMPQQGGGPLRARRIRVAPLESRAPLRARGGHSCPIMTRKLFVTTALPYANAPFHIGHMMEYIQADIWVRFQRMQGHEVHFIGADDAHGAPIMLAAEKAGKTPEEFIAEIS